MEISSNLVREAGSRRKVGSRSRSAGCDRQRLASTSFESNSRTPIRSIRSLQIPKSFRPSIKTLATTIPSQLQPMFVWDPAAAVPFSPNPKFPKHCYQSMHKILEEENAHAGMVKVEPPAAVGAGAAVPGAAVIFVITGEKRGRTCQFMIVDRRDCSKEMHRKRG